MSLKSIRRGKLIHLHTVLNHPIKGAANPHSKQITYSREQIELLLNEVESLMKADGLIGIDPNSKVTSE